jgi:hypothetical protein
MNRLPPFQITAAPGAAGPTDDEAAAIVAAIACLLTTGDSPAAAEPRSSWRGSATLISQGIAPARTPAAPSWATIERIRRARRGDSGITGL